MEEVNSAGGARAFVRQEFCYSTKVTYNVILDLKPFTNT